MKKTSSLMFALAFLGFSATASAEPGDYVNAQLAIADVDGFSDGTAIVATYGIPMPHIDKHFSTEAEFTTTLTDPDTSVAGINVDASYFTLAGYAVYTYPVNEKFDLRGRAGLLYEDVDVSASAVGVKASDDDFGLSFGFGVTYDIGKRMNVIAEYTVIESDITHLSAGIQYTF